MIIKKGRPIFLLSLMGLMLYATESDAMMGRGGIGAAGRGAGVAGRGAAAAGKGAAVGAASRVAAEAGRAGEASRGISEAGRESAEAGRGASEVGKKGAEAAAARTPVNSMKLRDILVDEVSSITKGNQVNKVIAIIDTEAKARSLFHNERLRLYSIYDVIKATKEGLIIPAKGINIKVYSNPSLKAKAVKGLPKITKATFVQILETDGYWAHVAIKNKTKGWIYLNDEVLSNITPKDNGMVYNYTWKSDDNEMLVTLVGDKPIKDEINTEVYKYNQIIPAQSTVVIQSTADTPAEYCGKIPTGAITRNGWPIVIVDNYSFPNKTGYAAKIYEPNHEGQIVRYNNYCLTQTEVSEGIKHIQNIDSNDKPDSNGNIRYRHFAARR